MNGRCLAVIPARGGSKSIPRKNIVPLAGKPLIAWTIDAALAAPGIDRVIVSTEDAEIADTARACGAEVPFLRPAELARDDTPGIDPLIHAVQWLGEHENYLPEWVVLLQPTSPLRTADDITAAQQLAAERNADAVVSLRAARDHPVWCKRLDSEGRILKFNEDTPVPSTRQELAPAYGINGAIYLVRREILIERRTFYTAQTFAYVMPVEHSLDIDSPWDFEVADLILRARNNGAA